MNVTWFLELLASLSVQAVLVVLATSCLARVARDSRIACRIWSAGYVVLLGLVVAALLLPHPRWIPRFGGTLSRPAAVELLMLEVTLGRVLFGVWLAGAVGVWGWMVVQSVRVARFLKTCRPVPTEHPGLHECRDVLATTAGVDRVSVLSCPALASPFCWQFHRPYIVLPDFLLGLAPRELRFIVRHELAHLRTGHPLQLFLQRVVEVLFWFHPLVWWSARQVARCREFACDDAAIDQPAEVADYLRTLLIVVEHSAVESERAAPVLAFGRGSGIVASRARRLAEIARFGWSPRRSRRAMTSAACAWLIAVVSCFGLWLPVDVFASPRSNWSPWPRWSATVLREFGISARDFEVYDDRIELHELLEPDDSNSDHAAISRRALAPGSAVFPKCEPDASAYRLMPR